MKQTRFVALAAAVLLFVVGCSDKEAVNLDVTGTWSGTVSELGGPGEAPMELQLIDNNGQISGTAITLFTADVTGQRSGSSATLSLSNSGMTSDIDMEGSFSGSSFTGDYFVDGAQTATFDLQKQ